MIQVKGGVCVVICCLVLSGCATTSTFHHMDYAARPQLENLDVFLVVPQDEIFAEVEKSNTAMMAGGGLLFALIDSAVESSRTKTAEELIQPLRDSMLDFDYPEYLAVELKKAFSEVGWLKVINIDISRSIVDNHLQTVHDSSSASAIIYMNADFFLTPEFHSVTSRLNVGIFPKNPALLPYRQRDDKNDSLVNPSDVIYKNIFEYTTPVIDNPKLSKEESVTALAQNNSEKVVNALKDNVRIIIDLLKKDIEVNGASEVN